MNPTASALHVNVTYAVMLRHLIYYLKQINKQKDRHPSKPIRGQHEPPFARSGRPLAKMEGWLRHSYCFVLIFFLKKKFNICSLSKVKKLIISRLDDFGWNEWNKKHKKERES